MIVAAWILLSGAWIDALATLLAAGLPAAGVLAVAFSLPGLTRDGEPHATRAARRARLRRRAARRRVLIAAALARIPPPDELTRPLRRLLIGLVAVACAAALVVGALHARHAWDSFTNTNATELPNTPDRLGESGSNFRWAWWNQAWKGFEQNRVTGTGAGTFQFTNERYRTSDLDQNRSSLTTCRCSSSARPGSSDWSSSSLSMLGLLVAGRRRPGPQLALALALPAYLLHGVIDIDWDFAAVSAPVFLIAGALIARPTTRPRMRAPRVLALSGIGLALCCSLFAIWLGNRWTDEAANLLGTNNAQALALVQRARSVDPLSIQPLLEGAVAESSIAASLGPGAVQRLADRAALAFLVQATQLQPENSQAWYELGWFELHVRGCPRAALPDLSRFTVLDGQNPENVQYALALKEVNAGTYFC